MNPADEFQFNNVKNERVNSGGASPKRVNQNNADYGGLRSPEEQQNQRVNTTQGDDEKNADEKAEEKKKMDMMRKFYRNRYNSFLQALAEQKAKKEQEEKAIKEAAEKKKQKVTQKVLGDVNRVKSKLFDQNMRGAEGEMEEQLPA